MKQGDHDKNELQDDRSEAQVSSKPIVSVSTRSESATAHTDGSQVTLAAQKVTSVSLAGRSSVSMSPVVLMSFAILGVGFALIVGNRRKTAAPNGYAHLLGEP